MSQLGIPGALPSGVGAVPPIVFPSGGKIVDDGLGNIAISSGQLKNGQDGTGAGTAVLSGANCPAVTVGAPHVWVKMIASDGDQVFLPAWK
jgi:hypothetical protein